MELDKIAIAVLSNFSTGSSPWTPTTGESLNDGGGIVIIIFVSFSVTQKDNGELSEE